jgi:hypothetical protein
MAVKSIQHDHCQINQLALAFFYKIVELKATRTQIENTVSENEKLGERLNQV